MSSKIVEPLIHVARTTMKLQFVEKKQVQEQIDGKQTYKAVRMKIITSLFKKVFIFRLFRLMFQSNRSDFSLI